MGEDERFDAFCEMMEELDRGAYLIDKYDSLLHDYNGVVMFQAESQMIKAIGDSPGITAARLAKKFGKSAGACSQLIRKLKSKEWVSQVRNRENSREYNLILTEAGKDIYIRTPSVHVFRIGVFSVDDLIKIIIHCSPPLTYISLLSATSISKALFKSLCILA